jgi:SAM-dependent methyltransferase
MRYRTGKLAELGKRKLIVDTQDALAKFYGDDFYKKQVGASLASAMTYAALLAPLFRPASVVDLGCGRGTWLKAFKDIGATKLVGYDGNWNTQRNMIDQSIVFRSANLNEPIRPAESERFDLAMSLEVAEHLEPSSARTFIRSLTDLSNVILFSAAYTKQGGDNHVNEQPHTYWAEIFMSFEYVPYDLFRPVVWGDKEIPFWYQQNTFLYVRRNTHFAEVLANVGHYPIKNLAFMDCVHPSLYQSRIGTKAAIKELAAKAIPKPLLSLAQRIKSRLT